MLRDGDPIDVRFTKWGGGRHWELPLRWLGEDAHGVWGAGEVGTRLWRPGAVLSAEHPVVLDRQGSLLLDDQDELEAHRVELGYPDDVVDLARRTADEVLAAIRQGTEPFGWVGEAWVARGRDR